MARPLKEPSWARRHQQYRFRTFGHAAIIGFLRFAAFVVAGLFVIKLAQELGMLQ
jgi:hypothetical protein